MIPSVSESCGGGATKTMPVLPSPSSGGAMTKTPPVLNSPRSSGTPSALEVVDKLILTDNNCDIPISSDSSCASEKSSGSGSYAKGAQYPLTQQIKNANKPPSKKQTTTKGTKRKVLPSEKSRNVPPKNIKSYLKKKKRQRMRKLKLQMTMR